MTESLPLVIENLSYGPRDPVFENANLKVRRGDFVTVLVEAGAAKSNLIECLLGNLKPTAGKIHFWGKENRGFDREMIQQRAGWIISKKEAIAPWVTIREDMLATSRLYRNWNLQLFKELVEKLKLDLDRRITVLAAAEMWKVKLIKAIAFEPELLVLDEVFPGLTEEAKELFTEVLMSQFAGGEMGVLYICNTPQEALRFSDLVCVLGRNGLTQQTQLQASM